MDVRVKKTKEKLHQALLKLLRTEPLTKITVRELCTEANVNRTTFYVHYGNVADCFQEISSKILIEMRTQLRKKAGCTPTDFLHIYFRIAKENQIIFRVIHSTNIQDPMIREMVNLSNEFLNHAMYVPKENENLAYTYILSGFYGMVGAWLQDGCQESEEELQNIMRLFYPGHL